MSDQESAIADADFLDEFTPVDEDAPNAPESSPEKFSPEWTDYVLSLLTKDEFINERPRADGLVRLCGVLVGDINWGSPEVHHVGVDYAAVTITPTLPNGVKVFGSAECTVNDTDAPYNRYPLATAETRAIGRAAKRILGLTNVLTAEETSKVAELTVPEASNEDRTEGSITDTQIKFIDRMCKKLNVDVQKSITEICGEHGNIRELSHAEALQVNTVLDEWTREEDQEYAKFGPYEDDWRNSFEKES